jgi:hypothetical protein
MENEDFVRLRDEVKSKVRLKDDGTFDLSEAEEGIPEEIIKAGHEMLDEHGGLRPEDLKVASVFSKAMQTVLHDTPEVPLHEQLRVTGMQFELMKMCLRVIKEDIGDLGLAGFLAGMCVATEFQEQRHA